MELLLNFMTRLVLPGETVLSAIKRLGALAKGGPIAASAATTAGAPVATVTGSKYGKARVPCFPRLLSISVALALIDTVFVHWFFVFAC